MPIRKSPTYKIKFVEVSIVSLFSDSLLKIASKFFPNRYHGKSELRPGRSSVAAPWLRRKLFKSLKLLLRVCAKLKILARR